jgi:hypothetical protein
LLFLQEIISGWPLLRRRNPRLRTAQQTKEQRDNSKTAAAQGGVRHGGQDKASVAIDIGMPVAYTQIAILSS